MLFVFRLGGELLWRVLFRGIGPFGCVWSIDGVYPSGVLDLISRGLDIRP